MKMTKENRVQEIKNSITSFSKESFHKTELLTELLALQQDLVNITFNEDHAENGQLKLWDVESHLQRLNEERGNIADEELQKFADGNRTVINMIKAECSGNRGEDKAYASLITRINPEDILRNVELKVDGVNTEIDFVVLSKKGVFIIEVKNTSKNIFIDEAGNYYCISNNYTRFDSNIAEKLITKEKALKEALGFVGYKDVDVKSLVVFTNSRIDVKNRFKHINTCFVGQLPYIEEDYARGEIYSHDDILRMKDAVENARCKESYPVTEIDIEQFKTDFATVMAILESVSNDADNVETEAKDACERKCKKALDRDKVISKLKSLNVNNVAVAVACASVLSNIITLALHKIKNR